MYRQYLHSNLFPNKDFNGRNIKNYNQQNLRFKILLTLNFRSGLGRFKLYTNVVKIQPCAHHIAVLMFTQAYHLTFEMPYIKTNHIICHSWFPEPIRKTRPYIYIHTYIPIKCLVLLLLEFMVMEEFMCGLHNSRNQF